MDKPRQSWEAVILLFAAVVTVTTMLAYRFMITYNWTIPWYVWVLLVVGSAVVTIGPRLVRRRR